MVEDLRAVSSGFKIIGMVSWLEQLTVVQAAMWSLAMNVVVFGVSLVGGEILLRIYRDRRVTPVPDPISANEIILASGAVVLNSLVAVVGWWMWRRGIITVRTDLNWRVLLDIAVLMVAMDFCMYALHRIAHHPLLFPIVHRTHHRYDRPRPINLFVLNPFEVMGFGTLWLIVLSLYSATWAGIIIYLGLNLFFGTIGHLGVEPFPASWHRLPLLRYLGSSTFHATHHQDEHVNYGFYSNVWDRLFGTGKRE